MRKLVACWLENSTGLSLWLRKFPTGCNVNRGLLKSDSRISSPEGERREPWKQQSLPQPSSNPTGYQPSRLLPILTSLIFKGWELQLARTTHTQTNTPLHHHMPLPPSPLPTHHRLRTSVMGFDARTLSSTWALLLDLLTVAKYLMA